MVSAIINIQDHTNRVLNIVKAKYNLKDKSQAIDMMAKIFEDEMLEPELRPEFIEDAKRTMNQKPIYIGTAEDLKKRYGVK